MEVKTRMAESGFPKARIAGESTRGTIDGALEFRA